MNKSLLIIICDFLLLSLLALARFDGGPAAPPDQVNRNQEQQQVAVNTPSREKDLVDAMKMSLEEEKREREELLASLARTEDALKSQQEMTADQQMQIKAAQQQVQEREAQIEAAQKRIREREEEARRLEQARAELATQFSQTQTNLLRIQEQLQATSAEAKASQERLASVEAEFAAAQTNLITVQKELSSTSTEARMARERLAQVEADLKLRQAEAAEARKRITQVEEARLAAEVQKERLSGDLKVAEVAKQMTEEQLVTARDQIVTVQQEKQQIQEVATELAQGVVTFAEKQGELTKEIRENRPLTANTIFSEFITNRVGADFRANRSGVFGQTVSKDTQARTILVSDGDQTYAIFHISDTPLRFEEFGRDWDRLVAHLYRMDAVVPLKRISFLSLDPRIAVAPVPEEEVAKLKATVYKVVADPYKFQDALLIGADEGYYGECTFQIDAQNPEYVRMDRSALGRLVGKFNPKRGDLVFSKSGDLLGMMVNDKYCALLTSFVPTATIPTGANLSVQQTGQTLSQMQAYINQLPEGLR